MQDNEKILYKEESYKIQGAIFEVYKEMGSGFLEAVYQECLEKEFKNFEIPFAAQQELRLFYKDEELEKTYKPDFLCYKQIIVEIKAIKEITQDHKAQVINYLKASKMKLGILVNFGTYPKVEIERLVRY